MPPSVRLLSLLAAATFAASVVAQAELSPQAQTAPAAERRWLVLVDDLHLDFVRTGSIRRTVTAVVRPLFEAGLLAAMRSDGPSSLALTVHHGTTWSDMTGAIKRITGSALRPADIVEMLAARRGPTEVVYRAQVAREAFGRLVHDTDTDPAVVLLVSNGYRTDIPAVSAHITEVAATAGRATVPIVVLDPSAFAATGGPSAGVAVPEIQRHHQTTATSLQLLANDTGGTIWENGDTLASVWSRLARSTP